MYLYLVSRDQFYTDLETYSKATHTNEAYKNRYYFMLYTWALCNGQIHIMYTVQVEKHKRWVAALRLNYVFCEIHECKCKSENLQIEN